MGEPSKIDIVCPRCHKQLTARADLIGRVVRCPNTSCGERIEVKAKPEGEREPKPLDDFFADPPSLQRRSRLPALRGKLPLLFSCAALAIALVALGVAVFRSPLGRGLSSYDFTTPEAAVKSYIEIEKNDDIKAQLELNKLVNGKADEEAVRTFEIHRTADFNDRKLLFVSYTRKGKKVKKIESLVKDPESKLWVHKYTSSLDVRKVNEQLAKEMDAWESKDLD